MSEELVAYGLKKCSIPRDEMIIATKYSNLESGAKGPNSRGNSKKSLKTAVELSLKRLETSYVDLLYVHFWDFTIEPQELMRSLDDMVRSGKVLHIAISDAPAWEVAICNTLADFHGWSPFVGYQGRYSLVDRQAENDVIPMSQKLGLSFVPWAVLGQGKLTGKTLREQKQKDSTITRSFTMSDLDFSIQDEVIKISHELSRTGLTVSPSQVAIRWCMQKPYIPSVMVGTRTFAQYEDAMNSLNFKLSNEQMAALDEVSKPAIKSIFPHDFIGGSYQTNQWLTFGGDPYKLE